MKSTRSRILTIGAAILIAVSAAFAQGPHGHDGPGGPDNMLGFMSDYLDLSSAQQDQIKAIWAKEKTTMKPLMQQMHQNHAAMEALQSSGAFDEAKTRALATQQAQTQIELEVQHQRIKAEMMQVLTADQKAKYSAFQAKREARMQNHNAPPPPPED